MSSLRFYFDPQSPYSYLAWCWLYPKKDKLLSSGIEVKPLPISMGSLISSYETKGPAEIPPKRDFLFKQCLRKAKRLNLELNTPLKLPINPVYLLRLCLVEVSGKSQWEVIDEVFQGIWRNRLDMESDIIVDEILVKRVGQKNFNEIHERSSLPLSRKALKANLAQAKDDGAFGVPTFVFNNELFWGHDSIEDLSAFIDNKDVLPEKEYSHFVKLFNS